MAPGQRGVLALAAVPALPPLARGCPECGRLSCAEPTRGAGGLPEPTRSRRDTDPALSRAQGQGREKKRPGVCSGGSRAALRSATPRPQAPSSCPVSPPRHNEAGGWAQRLVWAKEKQL